MCLLVHCAGDQQEEAADARKVFGEFCRENGIQARFEEIEGANHNFYSLEWKRQVIEISAAWLEEAPA